MFNPISGAGRSAAAAEMLIERLRKAGHEVAGVASSLAPPRQWLHPALDGVELVVAVGGDGAVRMAASAVTVLPNRQPALYHFPQGTENLFAREFGMDRNVETLLRAMEHGQFKEIDVGIANGRTFLLMASVGFDAEVVHDLASRRGASISHWTYVAPILKQLWTWRPPRLAVEVDGERIVPNEAGFVVVGNCMQYGWRLNPATRACLNDGLLDVVFFPCRSRLDLVRWAIRCRRGTHLGHSGLVYRTGRHVLITSASAHHFQLDGDPPGVVHEMNAGRDAPRGDTGPLSLDISLTRSALRVLLP